MAADALTFTKNMIRMVVDTNVGGAHDTGAGAPAAGVLAQMNLSLTPFRPGQPFLIELEAAPVTAVGAKLQTAPRYDPATGARPATGSSLWVDLFVPIATTALQTEVQPAADAYWFRSNITGTPAAGTPVWNLKPSSR